LPRYISDLETNGFLDTVTKIHCAVLTDIDTGEVKSYTDDSSDYPGIDKFVEDYLQADLIVGHNWIKFDHEVIKKLYKVELPREKILDTLVLGRLIFPDIKQSDFVRARLWKDYLKATEEGTPWREPIPREFPGQMIGRHSLEAWGYRIGNNKGDYSKEMKALGLDPWEKWRPEMHSYMVQDADSTLDLFKRFMAREPSEASVLLAHRISWLTAQIERNGFPFDVEAATRLYGALSDEREALRRELIGLFPNWKVRLPDFIPKRPNRTKGYVAGVPVERWKEIEFNPTSRDHIADRLIDKYGWKPSEFTDGGKATVDEEVLLSLPYPEARKLGRYFLLDKRIGQLAEGDQAWLKVQTNGKIHAQYTINGAVTGRCTHSRPNISQVPRVSSSFGRECRALFHVPAGWVQLGADQQGLELRCLASDLANLAGDGGNYATIVTTGDVHTTNQEAAGLPNRDNAKTFIYGFLYGAGDEKIGKIVGRGSQAGKKLKKLFTERTPGLARLIKRVKEAAKRGWILGIDGRKLPIRAVHAALNTRLQSAGAVICNQWGPDADDKLRSLGLKHGWDGDYVFLSYSHDEYQLAVRDDPELISTVKQVLIETGRAAGDPYNFKCPLDVDVKQGLNWAECH